MNTSTTNDDQLLVFFKALADANRLKIVGLLAQQPYTVEQLAAIVREIATGQPDGKITAALFRDRIGTGRKLAIQILEFFDAGAITRRAGDAHHLR